MTFERTLASLTGTPWALSDESAPAVQDLVRAEARGENVSGRLAAIGGGPRSSGGQQGTIAVIPVAGLITQRIDWVGTSTSWISSMLQRAVADPSCTGIVLDVASPGGTVSGTPELADEIFRARSRKPIVAFVNPLAASAAYWIASQAHEVVVTRSGETGSIGVFLMHVDLSGMMEQDGIRPTLIKAGRYKTEMSPYSPLGDEAKAFQQKQVDGIHGEFLAAVARARGVPVGTVKTEFGQGRCLRAAESVRVGLADRIGTLADAVGRAGARAGAGGATALADRLGRHLGAPPASARARRLAELARDPRADARHRKLRLAELS